MDCPWLRRSHWTIATHLRDLYTMMRPVHLPLAALLSLNAGSLSAQCATSFTEDTVTIYFGYDPLACIELQPWVIGNGPVSYTWSTAATIPAITVCDESSSWYWVSTVDADSCVASDSIYVNVVDVRCGNGLNKVAVCHVPPGNPANAHTICISENGVPAHLAHGCSLGACAADSVQADSIPGDDVDLLVSPNPMAETAYIQLITEDQETVVLTFVDAMGRTHSTLYSGTIAADTPMRWPIASPGLVGDFFWVRCVTGSGKHASVRVLRID